MPLLPPMMLDPRLAWLPLVVWCEPDLTPLSVHTTADA
jgi:hypothetical protein